MDFGAHQASEAVRIFKAVSHPLRLRIVARLCDGPEHVTALAEALEQPQSIVSQQLRILRMSGLVAASRQAGLQVYRLAEVRLIDLLRCAQGCCPDPPADNH